MDRAVSPEVGSSSSPATRYYPGDAASVVDLIRHADAFRLAAYALMATSPKNAPSSGAPFGLCAVHAIELYLNALLQHFGATPSKIRGMQHDLAARTSLAIEKGLVLRKRTAAHLAAMHETREYLILRYGPEIITRTSQTNRLSATLEEVSRRVRAQCLPEKAA
jgi:hypothetical protein